jgi:hypothetical protein
MTERTIGSELFQAVFQMVEKDNEENYLLSRLRKVANVKHLASNVLQVSFINGWIIQIINDLDVYYLCTDRASVYCNEDNFTSKLSSDRISFYLNRILDIVMYGR